MSWVPAEPYATLRLRSLQPYTRRQGERVLQSRMGQAGILAAANRCLLQVRMHAIVARSQCKEAPAQSVNVALPLSMPCTYGDQEVRALASWHVCAACA